jgi:hypothetical protein
MGVTAMKKHVKLTFLAAAVVLFGVGDAWSRGPHGHGAPSGVRGGHSAGSHRVSPGPRLGTHGVNPALRIHANPFHRLPAPGAGGAILGRTQAHQQWQHNVARIRHDAYGRYHHLFTLQWYTRHPGVWHHRYPYRNAWVAVVGWPVLANWVGIAGTSPYDYGTVYTGDTYVVADETATQPQTQDPAELASLGYTDETAEQAGSSDWLPLGVFTIGPSGSKGTPDRVFEFSVNKNGQLSGSYYDAFSGQTTPLQGALNKTTQRAAWTVGSNRDVVMETNLGSFTQNEANVLVRQGKDQTDEWTMVRLEQPDASQPSQPAAANPGATAPTGTN